MPSRIVTLKLGEPDKGERRRLVALSDVSARLAAASTPREVAEAAADAGVEALDARAAAVLVLRGDVLDITAGRGYPAALLDAWNPLSLDQDTPVCRSA